MRILTLALGLALATTAQAATHEHDLPQHQTQAVANTGNGVLKAINAKDSKVQIAHEPITALGWPAMTMWFVLKIPLPQDINVGDSVHFEMQQNDLKQWTVVKIGRK